MVSAVKDDMAYTEQRNKSTRSFYRIRIRYQVTIHLAYTNFVGDVDNENSRKCV